MNAAQIAATLGDPRREGRAWRCRCPLCFRRNFTLQDGSAVPLVTCWDGCDRRDVLAELRRRGLLGGRADYAPRIISAPRRMTTQRAPLARSTSGATQTTAPAPSSARYLASRGIALDQWPPSLRFHPRCPRPRDDAGNFVSPLPAMVALVEHVERGPMAVHCTYLRPDGSGKADIEKPKAIFGPVGGGAVRFGMPRAGEWLAVAEGIETALTVARGVLNAGLGRALGWRDQKPRSAARGDARRYLRRSRRERNRRARRARRCRAMACGGPARARCHAA